MLKTNDLSFRTIRPCTANIDKDRLEKDVRLSFRYFRKEEDKIWSGNFLRVGNTVLNNIELIEIYNYIYIYFLKSFRNVSTFFVIFSVDIEDAYSSEEEDHRMPYIRGRLSISPKLIVPHRIPTCLTQTSQFKRHKNNVLFFFLTMNNDKFLKIIML